MAEKKRGLGRGIDFLLQDNSPEDSDGSSSVMLKISDIEPNKNQARKNFDDEALSELADSISKHGVLQPLLVRPLAGGGYQLIAGERRWRASRLAGLAQVPVIIKPLSDEEAAVISLIENLQREDLDPVEEAKGYHSLITEYGLTQEQAAERVGKSRPAVANSLRILKLPDEVLSLISSGELSAGHAKALAGIEDRRALIQLAKTAAEKGLSVRETEKLAKALSKTKTPQKSKQARRDSFFDEVELSLNNSLGRKAKVVTTGKKENGTLEIDFYDKDDLARIVRALSSLE